MAEISPKPKVPQGRSSTGMPSMLTQVDLRQLLVIMSAHLLPALAIVIVVCTLVAWQQLHQPKLYMATAALLAEGQDRVIDMKQVVDTSFDTETQISTRLEQMRSPDVVSLVVKSLTPEERTLVLAPYYKGPPPIQDDGAVRGIVSGVSLDRRGRTMLINVGFVHRDPQAAALLANRFAAEIIRFIYDRTSAGNDAALSFLNAQAEDLRQKIEASERQLLEYRQKSNLVSLEEGQNIVVERLKSLSAVVTEARVARLTVETTLNQAESILKNNSDVAQLASIAEFSALTNVQSKIDDLKEKRAVMAERYGKHHPLMEENQREIDSLERLRKDQIQAALASLRNQRDKAVTQEKQLADQLAAAEQESLRLDRVAVDYNVLRRAVDTQKQTYSTILTRLNEATITAQLQGVKIRVSEQAFPSYSPISPNPRRTVMVTVALAIIILLGYPFTVEMLFARVRSWGDVEYYLGTDLLAEIGSVKRINEGDRPHLVEKETDESVTEQFRALHAQLQLNSKIDPPKTILITSTVPGEGKSFVACNLAATFVAHGRRVLLIDGDLRRPSQHRNYKIDNKAGMLRWLEEGGTLDGDLLADPRLGIVEIRPNFRLLRAGGSTRKGTELMESGTLARLIEALQPKFDIIILDTPPAGVFPDAVAFARVCQELIYICRFNTVSRQQARGVIARLRQTGLEFPGIVLNDLPTGRSTSYYYYGYGYHSRYYGKYYHEKKA